MHTHIFQNSLSLLGIYPIKGEVANMDLNAKGRWTPKWAYQQANFNERSKVANTLLLCPFWFLAQLTFDLSLKYTTVTESIMSVHSFGLFSILG